MNRWPKPIDHVFILCNPDKEPDRAAYLFKWLSDNNIDPSSYTIGLDYYGDSLSDEEAFSVYNPWINRPYFDIIRSQGSFNMKKTEISLCMNWYNVAKKAVENNEWSVIMTLESDIIFCDDFLTKLETAMNDIEDGRQWDFLSISAGAKLRPHREEGDDVQKWFKIDNYLKTRTTDAMIFKTKFLFNIVCTFYPIADVLDWELNHHITLHNGQTYWLDPPIVHQGSETGEYKTLL